MITQAIILAAGFGSRLAKTDSDIKPLRVVGGASLIRRNLTLLAMAGVERAVIVVGYRSEQLVEAVKKDAEGIEITVVFAHNDEYEKSNGISVLKARACIDNGPFLLLMADHVFDARIVKEAAALSVPEDAAILCVDYKLDTIFDMPDATKVVTNKLAVLNIGKELETFNAVDTGMFACSSALFEGLVRARLCSSSDDCSLSDGVRHLMRAKRMFVHDVGDALWQDVDTELALQHVERLLRSHTLDAGLHAALRAAG